MEFFEQIEKCHERYLSGVPEKLVFSMEPNSDHTGELYTILEIDFSLVPELINTDAIITCTYIPYTAQHVLTLRYDAGKKVSIHVNDEELWFDHNAIQNAWPKLVSRYRLMKGIENYG